MEFDDTEIFREVDLENNSLGRVDLSTDFRKDANLEKVSLPPDRKTDFRKTDFRKTDFRKTDFQKTDFQKTDFQKLCEMFLTPEFLKRIHSEEGFVSREVSSESDEAESQSDDQDPLYSPEAQPVPKQEIALLHERRVALLFKLFRLIDRSVYSLTLEEIPMFEAKKEKLEIEIQQIVSEILVKMMDYVPPPLPEKRKRGRKPYYTFCNKCLERFPSYERCRRHRRAVHNIKTYYQCAHCATCYDRKPCLIRHMSNNMTDSLGRKIPFGKNHTKNPKTIFLTRGKKLIKVEIYGKMNHSDEGYRHVARSEISRWEN